MALSVLPYSEKSFAVVGDTKTWRENLKELNGKFSPFLSRPDYNGGQKFAAFIFSNKHLQTVQAELARINAGQVQPKPIEPKKPKDVGVSRVSLPGVASLPIPTTTMVAPEGMQYVHYTKPIALPRVGQTVLIDAGAAGQSTQRVIQVLSQSDPKVIDYVSIGVDMSTPSSALQIINGAWQAYGVLQPHTITFY